MPHILLPAVKKHAKPIDRQRLDALFAAPVREFTKIIGVVEIAHIAIEFNTENIRPRLSICFCHGNELTYQIFLTK